MKNIGKPCAGKLHARFDEGGLAKAAMVWLLRHRQTKGTGTDRPNLKRQQPSLYSTSRILDLGRVMLAVEKYKKGEASLEKAARLAGVSLSKMMDVLAEYGVEANLEYEDYLKGLKTIRKVW